MTDPSAAVRDPYELRQVQMPDGALYVRGDDVVASLRARAAAFSELAERTVDDHEHVVFWAVAEAFAAHADQLDLAAIGCVSAAPSPWAGGRR